MCRVGGYIENAGLEFELKQELVCGPRVIVHPPDDMAGIIFYRSGRKTIKISKYCK
ncbi:MAG: hypothetical protein ACI8XC_000579 [Gammaproteobacteria bacterium]|jgi:hypothetical protein